MSAPLPSISFVLTQASFSDMNVFITVQPTVIYTSGPAPVSAASAPSTPSAAPNGGPTNAPAPNSQSVPVSVANDGPRSITSAIQRAVQTARNRLRAARRDH